MRVSPSKRPRPLNPLEGRLDTAMKQGTFQTGKRNNVSKIRRFFYENGLSIVLFGCFLVFLIGQGIAGHHEYNEDLKEHGQPGITLTQYLGSDHFLEATAENWESEFLQMFAYVMFTIFLYQKGSSESKKPGEPESVDREPMKSAKDAPWPVRKGGVILKLYENSLALVFLLLFLGSFMLHAVAGARLQSQDQELHGKPTMSVSEYLGTSRFWFEALQNWQSEFLAIGSMVFLSIFLRQKGSPESKPVDSPHAQTGKN
jgi:hypothetical protein